MKKGLGTMRSLIPLVCAAALLSACAPSTHTDVTVVHPVPHAHGVHRSAVLEHPGGYEVSSHTVRTIRPDATGAFPGDYAAAWNAKPAYEAAHHGGGTDPRWQGSPTGGTGKYEAPAGKYEAPTGKYEAQGAQGQAMVSGDSGAGYSGAVAGRRPVPGHSAYEAHRVYRPPMDCGIVSQTSPEPWVGERYVCVEN
jgi:hypothetical protein